MHYRPDASYADTVCYPYLDCDSFDSDDTSIAYCTDFDTASVALSNAQITTSYFHTGKLYLSSSTTTIVDYPVLQSATGFHLLGTAITRFKATQLHSILGSIIITGNSALTSVQLNSLQTVFGDFIVTENFALTIADGAIPPALFNNRLVVCHNQLSTISSAEESALIAGAAAGPVGFRCAVSDGSCPALTSCSYE